VSPAAISSNDPNYGADLVEEVFGGTSICTDAMSSAEQPAPVDEEIVQELADSQIETDSTLAA
jgi:hypothetical protein